MTAIIIGCAGAALVILTGAGLLWLMDDKGE